MGLGIYIAVFSLENKVFGEHQLQSARTVVLEQETRLAGDLLWPPKWDFYLKQWYLLHRGLWKIKTCFLFQPGHMGRNPGLLVMGSSPNSPQQCWNTVLVSCRRLSKSCSEPQGLGAAILNLVVGLVHAEGKKNQFLIMNLVLFLHSEEICSTAGSPGGEWRNTA